MVYNLSDEPSVLEDFVNELRDIDIQKDRMRFRQNVVRAGRVMAYELSKKLEYKQKDITTPLGSIENPGLAHQPVIASVLRAGLPLQQGFVDVFDKADCAFISAYRKHHSNEDFEIKVEYGSCPDLEGRELILVDTMLATGRSMALSYEMLVKQFGTPAKTHFVSIVSSTEGIDFLKEHIPKKSDLWVAAVDDELTAQAYIVPGLGDAGDLCYGEKG